MSMTQAEAVFQAIVEVVGEIDGVCSPTKAQLAQVYERVFGFFKSGATSHRKNPSDVELKKYIPGLVNNSLRKDKRLNGGTQYTAKNPGSRSGSSDPSIKALRQLLSVTKDPEDREKIQGFIQARLAELKPQAEIDVAHLPEGLLYLVNR